MQREKFQSAEQLWFWFLYARGVTRGLSHGTSTSFRRACELIDVETLITKLYLAGRLTDTHLAVMKKYGDMRRPPNPNAYSEYHESRNWTQAMQIIRTVAVTRGWIEKQGGNL